MAQRKQPVQKTWVDKYAKRVTSQNGEDGLIQRVFNVIGYKSRLFLEFGFGVTECNAWNLLVKQEFRGCFIDCNRQVHREFGAYTARPDRLWIRDRVVPVQATLTVGTIEQVVDDYAQLPRDIDFLSIDVDGNDYWLWQRLEHPIARLVVIEYNPAPGKKRSVSIPYDPKFKWQEKTPGFYHGASLAALAKLGKEKGYKLIGCEPAGVNAFFLREDIEGFDAMSVADAYRCRPPSQATRWRKVSDLPWVEV